MATVRPDEENLTSSISDVEKGSTYDQDNTSTPKAESKVDLSPENLNVDEEKQATPAAPPAALDWDGPDDPDNPMNWGTATKFYHAMIPGALCLIVYVLLPLSLLSTYIPSFPSK